MAVSLAEQQVIYYKTENGKSPYTSWFSALKDRRAKAKILTRVDRLRFGNFGDHKSLGQGLFELRLIYGPGFRVYFGRVGDQVVVLLSGGDKGSQDKDIEKARLYWDDFRRNYNGE